MRRWLLGGAVAAIVLAAAWYFRVSILETVETWQRPALPASVAYQAPTPVAATSSKPVANAIRDTRYAKIDPFSYAGDLPKSVNLAVPFLSQAPKSDWGLPYQEACEEASAIMVNAYYQGRTAKFEPDEGDKAILDLIAYEMKALGFYKDTTAAEVAQFMKGDFGFKTVVLHENPTALEIRSALANGYPVMVPADGKALKNPNFRNGGPLYHMLVLKGYLPDGRWITNDPGTRKGADYVYATDILLSANHDWNGGDVPNGRKFVIVALPN